MIVIVINLLYIFPLDDGARDRGRALRHSIKEEERK
jgi:hypothetical protein